MTEHDNITITDRIAALKKEQAEIMALKKKYRDPLRLARIRNRLATLQSWRGELKKENQTDPKVLLKIEGRKQLMERRRVDFEQMLVEIDKDPSSGKAVIFKSKDDVDAVFDLVHRELFLKQPPRTDLKFVGTPQLIAYMRKLIHKKVAKASDTKVKKAADLLSSNTEKEVANETK